MFQFLKDKALQYERLNSQAALEMKDRQIRELWRELKAAQHEAYPLKMKVEKMAAAVTDVFAMSDDELRENCRTGVYRWAPTEHCDEEGTADGRWEVVRDYCCLGGCDMNVTVFSTEREALLYCAMLSLSGYKSPNNCSCSSCYAEYMQDCI